MELTEIIFRLFAWVRPLLWYYHRLNYFLRVAIVCLQDDEYCLWLLDNPQARVSFESKLVDAERCLEHAIGFRVREILGLPMPATPRMGIGGLHRLHSPASLLRLAARLDRLVARYNDIERLAQLRARRIQREMEQAPILLVADHRPGDPARPVVASPSRRLAVFSFFALAAASAPAGQRIRGPPPAARIHRIRLVSTCRLCLQGSLFMPESRQFPPMAAPRPSFLEFFAGGGMARQGLAGQFDCAFANDFDPMKCATYRRNFPNEPLDEGDIWNLDPKKLPQTELAWASFPCQDLSLAGERRGLNAPRSGAFWGFWNVIERLGDRAPRTLAIENVAGLLSSHNGRDFSALVTQLADAGYRVGAMVIDAALFSPQSRQRLFIIAHKGKLPSSLTSDQPDAVYHPAGLCAAVEALPDTTHMAWVWWRLPYPPKRNVDLAALLERNPPEDAWRSDEDMQHLLDLMAPLHRQRVETALADRKWRAGAVFRRIRVEHSERVQRAEIRYDGMAGCLRTPAGGSSKQLLLVTENGRARLRPLLAREAARLMGCDDGYVLPQKETAALKVLGDGVSVPVVRWLGQHLLGPLASGRASAQAAA